MKRWFLVVLALILLVSMATSAAAQPIGGRSIPPPVCVNCFR